MTKFSVNLMGLVLATTCLVAGCGKDELWENNPKKIIVAKSGESLTDLSKRIIGKPLESLGLPLVEYSSRYESGSITLIGEYDKPSRPIFEVSQSCSVDKALPLGTLFGDLDCKKENLPRLISMAKDPSSGIKEACHGDAYDPSQLPRGYINARKGIYWVTGDEIFSVGVFKDFVGVEGGFGTCDLKVRAEYQKSEQKRLAEENKWFGVSGIGSMVLGGCTAVQSAEDIAKLAQQGFARIVSEKTANGKVVELTYSFSGQQTTIYRGRSTCEAVAASRAQQQNTVPNKYK